MREVFATPIRSLVGVDEGGQREACRRLKEDLLGVPRGALHNDHDPAGPDSQGRFSIKIPKTVAFVKSEVLDLLGKHHELALSIAEQDQDGRRRSED